jgi:hypothetical protein
VLCGDATNAQQVTRLLGHRTPHLMVTNPPYGVCLDSEWRDRAGLNGRGPAQASYLKPRTPGHTRTSISSDTRADWSEAFALVPRDTIIGADCDHAELMESTIAFCELALSGDGLPFALFLGGDAEVEGHGHAHICRSGEAGKASSRRTHRGPMFWGSAAANRVI